MLIKTNVNLREIDLYTRRPFFNNGRAYTTGQDEDGYYVDVPLDSNNDDVFFTASEWHMMDDAVVTTVKPYLQTVKAFSDHKKKLYLKNESKEKVYRDGDEVYPLPFTYKPCYFREREFQKARDTNYNPCIDTIKMASQLVAETVERLVLGVHEPFVFGDMPLYGMCNHPDRSTCVITNPYLKDGTRNPEWSKDVLFDEIGFMETVMRKKGFTGQLRAFVSTDWDKVEISSLLEFLNVIVTPFLPLGTIVLCEMTPATMQICCAMDFSLIQYLKGDVEVVDEQDTEKQDTEKAIYMNVVCSIIPVIHKNHCGIAHLTAAT